MSAYATKELSFDLPASGTTRANGGFSATSTEVIGRWVQRGTGNTVVLVEDGETPIGTIARIGYGKVAVSVYGPVRGKRLLNTATAYGKVVGAERVVISGQSAERGFIKSPSSPAEALKAVGRVLENGPDVASNTQGGTTTVLL